VLVLPNFAQPYVLDTDASSVGIGAILNQNNIPAATVDNNSLVKQEGLWFWKGKLVIPSNSNIKHILLKEFHNSPMGSHAGIQSMITRLTTQFFLEGYQLGNQAICSLLFHLSTSKICNSTTNGTPPTITCSQLDLARYRHGLHHRLTIIPCVFRHHGSH